MIEIVQICRPISSYDSPVTLDHLKYIKDRLIGTLGSSEVTDKLGNLALGLCDTAQMLEPMKWVEGEELGGSHADPDWPDKNIIPLIGGDKFVFSGKQISPMPVQKYIIENALLGDNSAGVCVDDMYRDIENYPTTSKEVTDVGGFCTANFYRMGDAGMGPYVYLRPTVSVAQSGLVCVNVTSLAHETSHAHDKVINPVLEIYPNSNRVKLRSELQAYAIGKVIQDYLMHEDGIMFTSPSTSDQVEDVRRRVNGPLWSEGAFDVSDDLIGQLDRAGLREIY